MLLPKGFYGKSDSGSSTDGGGGNNSDNSALVSIGNTSFGFNFDSEDRMMNNSPTISNNSEGGESEENGTKPKGAETTEPRSDSSDVKVSPLDPLQSTESAFLSSSDDSDKAVADLPPITRESNGGSDKSK